MIIVSPPRRTMIDPGAYLQGYKIHSDWRRIAQPDRPFDWRSCAFCSVLLQVTFKKRLLAHVKEIAGFGAAALPLRRWPLPLSSMTDVVIVKEGWLHKRGAYPVCSSQPQIPSITAATQGSWVKHVWRIRTARASLGQGVSSCLFFTSHTFIWQIHIIVGFYLWYR